MTNTQQNTENIAVHRSHSSLEPSYYLNLIMDSPFYQEGIHEINNGDRVSRHAYASLVADLKTSVAKQLSEQSSAQEGHRSLDSYALEVISHIRPFLLSNLRLESLRHRHDDDAYRQKRQEVQQLARFNRAVKEMVEHYPRLSITETLHFLTDINHEINEDDHFRYFEEEAREALVGIAHELYARQMLDLLPGIEYKEGGIQDDMHGADLFVSLNNSDYVPIDIKASEFTAEKKKQKAIIHGHDPYSIIDSKIPSEEVGNSFQVSQKVAERHKDELKEDIELAISSYYARKAQSL